MHQRTAEMNLADYVGLLKRQKLLIMAITALAVAAVAGLTSLQTPQYTATTEILVELEPLTDLVSSQTSGRTDRSRELENEVGFIESRIVLAAVISELGFEPNVEVMASSDRDFITIRATEPSAGSAVLAATAFADTYLSLRRELAVEEFSTTAAVVQRQIDDLDQQLLEIEESSGSSPQQRKERRAPIVAQRAVYEQGMATIALNSQLSSGAVGRVVSPAELPTAPSSPVLKLNLGLALVAGLMISLLAAIVRDTLADLVIGREVAQQILGDTAILAEIPRYRISNRASVLQSEVHSIQAESYRSLRTALAFATMGADTRVIQVTSSTMSEGKSEVVANLAVALARGGKRVLAVDADLRRPMLASRFGLDPDTPGLSSVVNRDVKLREALVSVEDLPLLSILPSGPMPNDPAAFVDTPFVAKMIRVLGRHFDYVIVDTPPVNMVSDPLTISQMVDGVVVVARHGRTNRTELRQTLEVLRRLNAPVLGLVLNGVHGSSSYSASYYHRKDRVVDSTHQTVVDSTHQTGVDSTHKTGVDNHEELNADGRHEINISDRPRIIGTVAIDLADGHEQDAEDTKCHDRDDTHPDSDEKYLDRDGTYRDRSSRQRDASPTSEVDSSASLDDDGRTTSKS